MAKVFLDTNLFIDIMEGRTAIDRASLESNDLFVSLNSLGIWSYIYKVGLMNYDQWDVFDSFNFVDLTESISRKSFVGPTKDYEDNVQLHSASEKDCNVFLTKDKRLLSLGYFGKVKIVDRI